MKHWMSVLSLGCLLTMPVRADQFTGWISDQKCASTANFAGRSHEQCVKSGHPIVFVNESDHRVLPITNPARVASMIGEKVTINGTMKGNAIEAETIVKASDD